MGEIIVVSSLKDNGGVSFYDLSTGSTFSHSLKGCMCDTGGLGVIGGPSAFSGKSSGGSGDYIVASQSKKPLINIYQWGKPQVQMQCRIQELTTSICVDANGFHIFGGTKGGRIFCWEISSGNLVLSWQAHYKSVTTMVMTPCGSFLVSGADDGMVRAWDVPNLLTSSRAIGSKKNIPPFRSWTPHSLPIANIILQQAGVFSPANFRAISVSADRTITIQEVFSNRQVAKIAFPEALTACASNHTMDVVYLGSASGRIYILDLSVTAVALSAAHAKVIHADTGLSSSLLSSGGAPGEGSGSSVKNTQALQEGNYSVLVGHDKAVTSLALSRDNYSLVSVSLDGTAKVWNTISRQCLKELNPFNKAPLSNVLLLLRPDVIDGNGIGNIHKPTLCAISHMRKYPDSEKQGQSGGSSVTQLDGNASLKGKNRRFVGGQAYCAAVQSAVDLVSNPDALLPVSMSAACASVSAVQLRRGAGGPAAGGSTPSPSLPAGDYVTLRSQGQGEGGAGAGAAPCSSSSCSSMLDELPPASALARQDTFGDEFYDNWKKNVKVRSVDRGLSSVSEANSVDESLSLQDQLLAWKRLASELQSQLEKKSSACHDSSRDVLEEVSSPRAQDLPPLQELKRKKGSGMVVLSETDQFKVPKNKGSGGGRKRYHESFLEEQQKNSREEAAAVAASAVGVGQQACATLGAKKARLSSDDAKEKADVVVVSKATPPARKKKSSSSSK